MGIDQEREQAHAYLDRLPPAQLSAVRTLLQAMVDPALTALANAPLEDEDISEEEERAVAEARESLRQRGGIPHTEAMRRLGLE